jgi:hypothetical protein
MTGATAPRWSAAELQLLADIAAEPDVDRGQQRLLEVFAGDHGQTTSRLLAAAVAADTLRAGGALDLGNGETFGRLVDHAPPAAGDRLVEAVDLEQLVAQLAGLAVEASTADRMLAEAVAELGADHLLGPCQRLLDRLRDEYHVGPDREAEPIGADLWRIGDGVARLCESVGRMHHPHARLRASVTGCVRAGRQFYVEASLAGMPQRLGEVAADIAQYQPLVLSTAPGRLQLYGDPWPLHPGLRGRCARDVTLVSASGQRAGIGYVVEVADPHDVEALAHELVHAGGGWPEDLAHRLGQDLARWAAAAW